MNQTVPPPPPTGGNAPTSPAGGSPGSAAAAKQGLPIWAWIGIGCGCLVVVAILVVVGLVAFGGKKLADFAQEMENNPAAAAELVVRLNPDLELVETDREAGKITIRNKETGEVATFDFSDIENGNFSFEGSDGSTFSTNAGEGKMEVKDAEGNRSTYGAGQNLDDLPDWLHLYPGAEVQVGFTQKGSGSASGALAQTTDDSIEEVADHFESYFGDQGWSVTRNQMTAEGETMIMVTGNSSDGTYSQVATVGTDDEGNTQISMQYQGPEN